MFNIIIIILIFINLKTEKSHEISEIAVETESEMSDNHND